MKALPVATIGCACLLMAATASVAGEPLKGKKVIEWGWDEPDTAFIKAHVDEMEKLPFDGFVFHAPPIDGGNFTWTMWGPAKFRWEGFSQPLADLQATKFHTLTDRFFRVNVTPGKVDWFDDAAWGVVLNNFGLAARFAKEGRCTGFMFDTEQYEGDLFSYQKQPGRDQRSFADYRQKVRQRGREWMQEVNRHFPDITILVTFGYKIAQPRPAKGEQDRSQSHYGLLADFLDGMFAACTAETKIVDAWEHSYGYKRREQFAEARETIKVQALEWTAEREKYGRHARAGFGIWMDNDWQRHGWKADDVAKNYFPPAEFETVVRAALEASDEYVWIYTEQPRWWTNEKLPAAYVAALAHARRPGGNGRKQ